MARPPRFIPRDGSRRALWAYLGLIAFVLLDVLLISWALRVSESKAVDPISFAAPTSEPVLAAQPEPTPSSRPSAAPAETVITAVPPTRILAALDSSTAWRATTGPCPATQAAPELTTDGGASWTATDATGSTQVTALQHIAVSSGRVATMIGLAQSDCAPQFVKTFVAGDNYSSYPDELDAAWYVDPANRAVLHSPSGDHPAPCSRIIALANRDADAAAVLCPGDLVYMTTDAAASWLEPLQVSGALAIAPAADEGYLAAAAGRAGCTGVQLLTVTDFESIQTGCFPSEASDKILPGSVALSEAANTVWLWVGSASGRSQDEGVTWQ
ncbi:MAG TPA: hypothetical protein VGP24_01320 [Glaciihabitans sp.]|nr:hypothetical protein [Glaciihabitans sp.]